MKQIIIDVPDHLAEGFLGWMSSCGEQDYMDGWQNLDHTCDKYLTINYPDWPTRIVIEERNA